MPGILPLSTFQFFGFRACAFAFVFAYGYLLALYGLLKADFSAFLDDSPQVLENVRKSHICMHAYC